MRIDRQTEGGSDLSDIGQNNMWMVLLSKPSSCPAIIIITVNSLSILITHSRCWLPIAHTTAVCVYLYVCVCVCVRQREVKMLKHIRTPQPHLAKLGSVITVFVCLGYSFLSGINDPFFPKLSQ